MSTIVKPRKKQLRGPRYRQERRRLRRGTSQHFNACDELTALTEEMDLYEEAQKKFEGIYPCETCGATGDDPCMTKSGKIASKEHANRRSL